MKKWRCSVCGYVHQGEEPPEKCPVCGADKSLFEEIIETPADDAAAPGKTPPPDSPEPSAGPRTVDLGPEPTTPLGRVLHLVMGQMLKHHAHPISVHFPNGVLPVAFIFIVLSVLFESRAMETAAYCNLVFVVLALPVVLFSGYVEWQKRYKGFHSRQFMVKITCAVAVFALSLLVVIWWTVSPDILRVPSSGRTLFMLCNLAALAAAGIAGLIGGKLVFKD
jgi:uncharacterized membrane protein